MKVLRYLAPAAITGAAALAIGWASQPTSAVPADFHGYTAPAISLCLRLHEQTGEPCAVEGSPSSDGTYVDEAGELHHPARRTS